MSTEFDVNANLRLRDVGFARSTQRASDRVQQLHDRLTRTQSVASSMFRSVASLGAGYFGIHALVGGLRSAIHHVIEFDQGVERMQIGLRSVIAAVDGISFEQAERSASAVWRALSEDALRSTATTAEMFEIFQGIVGPIRAAGASLQTVRDMTNSTVAAASALGVDFGQAQRDIGLMVRGSAGMDTRMFSLLTSMGLIRQTTEQWNRSLTTSQRIEELQRALGSFDAAAEAYGQSFAGATSSFKDIVQQLSRSLSTPIFGAVTQLLLRINRWLIANRDMVTAYLERAGQAIANAFAWVTDRAAAVAQQVTAHWDVIVDRFDRVRAALEANGPALQRLGVAMAGLGALRSALGPILSVASSVIAGLEALGLVGGAGGAAGGGAAAGGAAGGGGAAAGGLGAALGPLLIVLALIAAVVVSLTSYWEQWLALVAPLLPILSALGDDLMELGGLLWTAFRPIARIIGTGILLVIVVQVYALIAVLRLLVTVAIWVMRGIAALASAIDTYIVDPFIRAVLEIGRVIAQFLGRSIGADPTKAGGGRRSGWATPAGGPSAPEATDDVMSATPDARPQTVNNFHRGSVQVRQDFRESDPDRVLVSMVNELNRAAVQRVGSGFAPALTR